MINESELMQGRPIVNDIEADEVLAELREIEVEKNRFNIIANSRIEAIRTDLERRMNPLEFKEQFLKDQLRAYFLTVPAKETKTQKSYSLLSGKLIMKKSSPQMVTDEELLIKWASENATDYVEQIPKLKWGELKKTLKIANNQVITEFGEIVEGVTVQEKDEEFEVKF